MKLRDFRILLCLLAAALPAAGEEEKSEGKKPCVEIVSADGSDKIVVRVQNPTDAAISVLSPGNSWGDRSFHLIVQKPRGIITTGCFVHASYPSDVPAMTEIPAHSSKELALQLFNPLKQLFPDAVGITVTYAAVKEKEGETALASLPKGIDHLDGREKALVSSPQRSRGHETGIGQ